MSVDLTCWTHHFSYLRSGASSLMLGPASLRLLFGKGLVCGLVDD